MAQVTYAVELQNTKVVYFSYTHKCAHDYYRVYAFFFRKKEKNIWSYEKKIVILHDFSRIVGIGMRSCEAKNGWKNGVTA